MRFGENPSKRGLLVAPPKKLGLALLSNIPTQDGYHANSLEILKYQVASIHRTTKELDLMVFDNGSCVEVQEELKRLQTKGLIDLLMLSKNNVGKSGALNWILGAMPNEFIGFSDGDVLFRSGWWEKTQEILQAFPTCGLVSVQPCLYDVLKEKEQAHHTLVNDPCYQLSNRPLSPLVVEEYGRGIGLDDKVIEELRQKQVQLIKEVKSDVSAVIGQSHMQFVMPRSVARQVVPLPASYALYREEDKQLNFQIDRLGLLQLTSLDAYVYHMGNQLDELTLDEISSMNLDGFIQNGPVRQRSNLKILVSPAKRRALKLLGWLVRFPIFKKTIRRIYAFLFEYFAQEK